MGSSRGEQGRIGIFVECRICVHGWLDSPHSVKIRDGTGQVASS